MKIYEDISQSLQKGRAKLVEQYVKQAIDEGLPANEILSEGLLEGMNVIGEKFKKNEVYVPEVMIAARAMKAGTELLKPMLVTAGVKTVGRVCIGTVKGDMHDIGKNLVKMMMEGKGLEVIDLGTDVPPEKFVETVKNENCKVVACSALLTTTMCVMGEIVNAFKEAGLRDKVKIMVGGAPLTQAFCDEIGADAYTPDAASAAEVAANFCMN
jgi:corrinoid protein of di/trimethylamine methyltransferase